MLVFRGVYPRSIHSLGSWDWDLQTEVPITSSAKIWRHAVNEMDLSTNIFICIYTVYIYIYISIIGRSHDDLMDISSSLLHQFEWWIIFSLRTCNLPPPPIRKPGYLPPANICCKISRSSPVWSGNPAWTLFPTIFPPCRMAWTACQRSQLLLA